MAQKRRQNYFILLLTVFALTLFGCSRGPTDEEALKAINDTGLFAGGVEKINLTSPVVIVDKGSRDKNSAWPVTVRFTFTYKMSGGQETAPAEKTTVFHIYKIKDSSGKIIWKAK
jgi:hypothetical protein